jgi:hypothetical protein
MLLQTVNALFQSSAQTKAEQAVDISHGDAPCAPPFPPLPPPPPLPIVIAAVVGLILGWVLISLAVASFSKLVEYIYSDTEADDTITSKVFKSLPHALLRLFITGLWALLATVLLTVAISIPFGLLTALIHPKSSLIFFLLNSLPQMIGLLVLNLLLMLAQQIAVLEPENYGLAALKKSTHLVKSKVVTALLILLLSGVVVFVIDQLVMLVAVGGVKGKIPFWTVPIFWIIIGVADLAWIVYIFLATIVLYFSCKTEFEAQNGGLPDYTTNSGNPYTPLVHSAEQ